jgi:nitric oxide reductase NorE protein
LSKERRTPTPLAQRPPGSEGLWTFVFMDMVIFLLLFVTFMGERISHVALYSASQLRLNEFFGLANALILLTSSWMVVEAVGAARSAASAKVARYLGFALLLGALFVVNKVVEYTLKVRAGLSPATNSFFSYYYFITFIHLLHVMAGMGFIAYFRKRAVMQAGSSEFQISLENVGLFWHFVDVLWIFIFPMLYLMGRQ